MKHVACQFFNDQTNRPQGSVQIPISSDLYGVFGWSTNHIFKLFYGKEVSAKSFDKAITMIQSGVARVDHDSNMKDNPNHHFDAERFHESNEILIDVRIEIYNAIMSENYEAARNLMGVLLHTLQDFYSHSNWIELGNTVPNYNLGITGKRWGRKATPNTPTCSNCTRTCVLKICGPYKCRDNLMDNLKEGNLLTSGYYGSQHDGFAPVPKPTNTSKCSHGGFFDSTRHDPSYGGINKDSKVPPISPHYYLHDEASRISREASIYYLNGIRQDVQNDYKFGVFLGLLVGPSLVFCVDPYGNVIDNREAVEGVVGNIVDESRKAGMYPKSYVIVQFNHTDFPPVFKTTDPQEMATYISAITKRLPKHYDDTRNTHLSGIDMALKSSDYGSKVFVFTNTTPKDTHLLPKVLSYASRNKQQISVINKMPRSSRWKRDQGVYDQLVDKTGGQYMTFDSNVAHMFASTTLMQDSQRGSPVIIFYAKSEDPVSTKFQFVIDPSIVSFKVTASSRCEYPMIQLKSPSGKLLSDQINELNNEDYDSNLGVTRVELGSWKLNLRVSYQESCNWTVKVSGYSTLFQSVELKVLDSTANHPGLHTISGQPIVTENLTLVVKLSEEHAIAEKVIITNEYGEFLMDDLELYPLEERGRFYAFFIVPHTPFVISITGKDSTGQMFQRTDAKIVSISHFKIDRILPEHGTNKNLVPGETLTLAFNVTNLNVNDDASLIYFYALDKNHFNVYIHSYEPYTVRVNKYESFIGTVVLKAPENAIAGEIVRLDVTAGVYGTIYDNWIDVNITVFPKLSRTTLPDCRIIESVYDNICTTNVELENDCSTAHWWARMTFSDGGSGLSAMHFTHEGGKANYSLSTYNYVNLVSTNVTALVIGDCCVKNVTLLVYNKVGRYGSCFLHRFDMVDIHRENDAEST